MRPLPVNVRAVPGFLFALGVVAIGVVVWTVAYGVCWVIEAAAPQK